MTSRRPFLSYANADRDLVEGVAKRLIVTGFMPVYDHWWLRSAASDDEETIRRELKMGINHADAFVYFNSRAARRSALVDYECDRAMWRTCSDSPDLPMICVLLDDPATDVPDWFNVAIDVTASAGAPADALLPGLLDCLGADAFAVPTAPVRRCRELAEASDFERLRTELTNRDSSARLEAAILLALLDDGLDEATLSAVIRELERGLGSSDAQRAVFALGKMQARALPAVEGLVRFVESAADPEDRARAIRVLGRIGACHKTVSALVHAATRARGVQQAVVTELGTMGAEAAAAVPTLVRLTRSGDRQLRLVALTALGNIGDSSREVLVAVLLALAETEREGLAPSQLHHNAMSIMKQLAPTDVELAGALLPARKASLRFTEWFGEEFPDADAAIRGSASAKRRDKELLATARRILTGCRLVGADRPF